MSKSRSGLVFSWWTARRAVSLVMEPKFSGSSWQYWSYIAPRLRGRRCGKCHQDSRPVGPERAAYKYFGVFGVILIRSRDYVCLRGHVERMYWCARKPLPKLKLEDLRCRAENDFDHLSEEAQCQNNYCRDCGGSLSVSCPLSREER